MTLNDLVIRSLQGRATPREEAELEQWRKADAENEAVYQATRDIWGKMEDAGPRFISEPPQVRDLLLAAEKRSHRRSEAVPRRSAMRWLYRVGVAAAFVGLGVGIGQLASGDPNGMLSQNEVITGPGEMTTITLGDGTTVRVGPESHLRFTERRGRRLAWIEGRALFAVHSNPQRPFVVSTPFGEAEAHGTRFEVRAENAELRVLVVEGRVSLEAAESEVMLSPGQMSRSVEGQPPSAPVVVADMDRQLAWVGNVLVFHATPFSAAMQELERRFDVTVQFVDTGLGEVLVTATFVGQSLEQILPVLCETISARCTLEGEQIQIERSPARAGGAFARDRSAGPRAQAGDEANVIP